MFMGPFGKLIEFKCPASLESPYERPNSEAITIAGVRHTQRAPRSLRTWSIGIDLATPDDIANLIALEQGVYGPPPWKLYEETTAYVNLLVPTAASPGIPAGNSWLTGTPEEPVTSPSPNILIISGAAVEATSPASPVVPGRTYSAMAQFIDRPGGTTQGVLELEFVDSAMTVIASSSSGTITSPDRAVVTLQAPANAAGAQLHVTPASSTDGWFGSFQLVESDVAIPWHPGMGVMNVSIPGGFQQTYVDAFGTGSGTRRGIQLSIVEVGSAA